MTKSPPKASTSEAPASFVERIKPSKKRTSLSVPPYWTVDDLRRHTDILQSSVRHTRGSLRAIFAAEIASPASSSSTFAAANVPPLENPSPERDVVVVDPLVEVQRPGSSLNATFGSAVESVVDSGSSIQTLTRDPTPEPEEPLNVVVQENPEPVVEPTGEPEPVANQEPEQEPEQEIVQEPEREPEEPTAQVSVYITDPLGEPVVEVEPLFEEAPTTQAQTTSVEKVTPKVPCSCKDCNPEPQVVAEAPEVSPERIRGIFSALGQGLKQVSNSIFNREVLLPVVGEEAIPERESVPEATSEQEATVEPEAPVRPSTPVNSVPEPEVTAPTDSQEEDTAVYSTPCGELHSKPKRLISGINKGLYPFGVPPFSSNYQNPVAGPSNQTFSDFVSNMFGGRRDPPQNAQDSQGSEAIEDLFYYYGGNRFRVVNHDFTEIKDYVYREVERLAAVKTSSMDYGTLDLRALDAVVNELDTFQVFQRKVLRTMRDLEQNTYEFETRILSITKLIMSAHQRILIKTRPKDAAAGGTSRSSPAVVGTSGQPSGSAQGASASAETQAGPDRLTSAERQELAELREAVQRLAQESDSARRSERQVRSQRPERQSVHSRLGPRRERRPPTSPSESSDSSDESDDSPPRRGRRGDEDPDRGSNSDRDPERNPNRDRGHVRDHRDGRRHGHRRHRITYTRKQPTLTVKPFKGDKRDFIRFRTAFKDTYENVGLSRIPLAIHLAEHLHGDAGLRFGNMANSPTRHTYRAMWTALDAYYGTERELTMDKLDRFNQLPVIKSFSPATISMLFSLFTEIWPALEADLGDRLYDETHLTFHTFLKKIPLEEVAKYRAFCRATHQQRNFETFKEWLDEQWATYKNARPKEMGSVDKNLVLWQNEMENSGDLILLSSDKKPLSVGLEGWADSYPQVDEEGNTYFDIPVPENSYYGLVDGELQPIGSLVFKQNQRGRGGRGGRGGFGFARGGAKALQPPTQSGKPKQSNPKRSVDCLYCGDKTHSIYLCPKFEKLNIKDKYKIVREKRLCIRCLRTGHIAKDCMIRFVCDVDQCGKRHHRFLHPYNSKAQKAYLSMMQNQGLEEDLTSQSEQED